MKKDSLTPVVTQDLEGNVLMQAYANKQALKKTLETKKAWYWSRKRNKLWMKGEESGNTQEIIGIFSDCDNDSLLYIVKQNGVACHKKTYSCFTNKIYGRKSLPILEEVYSVIQERKEKRPEKSYVARIIDDEEKLVEKIREESEELIDAFNEDNNLVWEAADVIFHTLLLLANKNIKWNELEEEFRKRRK